MAKLPIDSLRKSVLCGTCLTDSSLRIAKNYANARIQCRHSSRQASWFFWKWAVCLKDYIKGDTSFVFNNADGYQAKSIEKEGEILSPFRGGGVNPPTRKGEIPEAPVPEGTGASGIGKLSVATKALPALTALHSIFTKNNKDYVSRSWLNHMNDYFLMVVWLDDGSLSKSRQGYICLDSTPKNQQQVFVDYLKTVWEIEAYVVDTKLKMRNGEQRYRIAIKNQESLLRLLRIVAPIIPVKEMLYKIMFVPFNNSDLLQRWASEVSILVLPEFRSYIRDEYQAIIKKKKKL
uniref:Putative LAGLIDADG homing endonuclease n=1 Tax=Stephanosphaera pluvialis TaxID=51712 RepID=A0A0S2IEC1_9CHLO|nr:putative LAGLIDADG homing endonuclease [Stephanosphaera pluvialis]